MHIHEYFCKYTYVCRSMRFIHHQLKPMHIDLPLWHGQHAFPCTQTTVSCVLQPQHVWTQMQLHLLEVWYMVWNKIGTLQFHDPVLRDTGQHVLQELHLIQLSWRLQFQLHPVLTDPYVRKICREFKLRQ